MRDDTPMTLRSEEVTRLRSMHDRLDMSEVEGDLPAAVAPAVDVRRRDVQRLFRAQQRFLGTEDAKMPYIIGIGGSVAAGKSTTARAAGAARAADHQAKVDLVTTDGFLYPNALLERENLMDRKGFRKLRPAGAAALPHRREEGRRPTRADLLHLVYDAPNHWSRSTGPRS